MLQKLPNPLAKQAAKRQAATRTAAYRDFVRREAVIGGRLFGPVPQSARREFVCLNKRTWVWHEEWLDANGAYHVITTRYDVRPDGIFKAQDGQPYQQLSRSEALHLRQAVLMYHAQVSRELYRPS